MNKIGIRVTCAVCHRQKKPRGRSMPVGFNMCEPESCSAYYCEPRVGDLWPGETAQDFGYPCSDDGTDAEASNNPHEIPIHHDQRGKPKMTIQRGDILICKSDIRSNGASFRSGDRVKVIAIGNDLCLIECMRTGTVRPLPLTQSHLFEKRV